MEEPLPGEEVLAPESEATRELEAQEPMAQCEEEELGAGPVADGAVATEELEPAVEEPEARKR